MKKSANKYYMRASGLNGNKINSRKLEVRINLNKVKSMRLMNLVAGTMIMEKELLY